MTLLVLLPTLLGVLTNILGQTGLIPASLAPLITQLAAAIPALIAGLLSGQPATQTILVVLQAIQTEVDALKGAGGVLPVNLANEIEATDRAVAAAIVAYHNGTLVTDPSNMLPLPETL